MNKKILVVNGGSSSIKFKMFDYDNLNPICSGLCERIFVDGVFELEYTENNEKIKNREEVDFANHELAVKHMINALKDKGIITDVSEIVGIGHRVVQGANYFSESAIINEDVEKKIEELIDLAPLHNKPEIDIVKIMKQEMSSSTNVAVFDTSFHTTIPELNSTYALPSKWRNDLKIKRYGAHGTSYRYITEEMKKYFNKDDVNLIICHLGNGASICEVKNGKSNNTTMGLTPLEGLVMGTRSGDVDPSIFKYVANKEKIDAGEIDRILNKESGLKALCNYTDFRDITPRYDTDENCKLAFDIFCKRVVEYVIKYTNELENKLDALIFTGGIGENVAKVRKTVADNLHIGHFHIDDNKNLNVSGDICKINKDIQCSKNIFVVKTNEELMIAKDVKNLIER